MKFLISTSGGGRLGNQLFRLINIKAYNLSTDNIKSINFEIAPYLSLFKYPEEIQENPKNLFLKILFFFFKKISINSKENYSKICSFLF